MKKMVLDIGCGNKKREGAIGIDICDLPEVDICHDLNITPYPFEDNFFDEIYMLDVIEHLDDTIKIMDECFRILKLGGVLYIRTGYWNHKYAWSDPTHKKAFSEISFEFFIGKRRNYYTKNLYSKLEIDFIYNYRTKKYLRSKGLLNFLAKYLCGIIQGMNVRLIK